MARGSNVIEQDGSKSKDVAISGKHWDDETLLGVDSFEAALALVENEFGAVEVASETLGNGFTVFNGKDKDIFIGIPMILMSWNFNEGDNGPFVSVTTVAKTKGGMVKAVINDGSTGIFAQLDALFKRTGKLGGLRVDKGLRRSDYTYTNDKGEESPASTYYLDTSA